MKTTVVPAQVTTVEDKIAGNFGMSQLLLLIAPLFVGAAIFAIFPPFFGSAPYKVVIIVCIAAISSTLAIRIKGKILLLWLIVVTRYNLRPRYFVFNKNDDYLRDAGPDLKPDDTPDEELEPTKAASLQSPRLSTEDAVFLEKIIANPAANLHFKTNKKGELSVHIKEVK